MAVAEELCPRRRSLRVLLMLQKVFYASLIILCWLFIIAITISLFNDYVV